MLRDFGARILSTTGMLWVFLLVLKWRYNNIQHSLNIGNWRSDILLSTILDIFQWRKTNRVIENVVIISDVIILKQMLSEIDFVRKNICFGGAYSRRLDRPSVRQFVSP